MYVVIFISLLAILLTYLETQKYMRAGMFWGFLLVTVLECIHYDYGNDYMTYYYEFERITKYEFDFNSIMEGESFRDPGWAILCYIFKDIGGFFTMVATLSIIQNILIYRFIRNRVDRNWWTLSVFIYLFTSSFYLLGFSMLRQWFVMCVFLAMWSYIERRRWWVALIIFYLCSLVHGSAIILLPFSFWGFLRIKNGKIWAIAFGCLLVALWMFRSMLDSILLSLLSANRIEGYVESYEGGDVLNPVGIGYMINLIPFVVSMYFLFNSKKYSVGDRQLVALSIVSFFVLPFTQIMSAIGRISLYFELFSLPTIPLTYGCVSNKLYRHVMLMLFVMMHMIGYYGFFNSPVYEKSYATFHTIFSILF